MAVWIALSGLSFTLLLNLVGFVWMLGRLFERVKVIEERAAALAQMAEGHGSLQQRVTALEQAAVADAGIGEQVIRMDERMKAQNDKLDKVIADLHGVSRQLGTIASKGLGFQT